MLSAPNRVGALLTRHHFSGKSMSYNKCWRTMQTMVIKRHLIIVPKRSSKCDALLSDSCKRGYVYIVFSRILTTEKLCKVDLSKQLAPTEGSQSPSQARSLSGLSRVRLVCTH